MGDFQKIRIGTRGSPLALVQTGMVRARLAEVAPEVETEIVVIKTTGDWQPEQGEVRLEASAGGKASFAKEIEEALLSGAVDIAVHSMKDMETHLPQRLSIPVMLPREDARDCLLLSDDIRGRFDGKISSEVVEGDINQSGLILHKLNKGGESLGAGRGGSFAEALSVLPEGATVGTASVRRQAFLLSVRPDLKIVPLRGNVQTRIDKVRSGQVDATFLALAGLNRLALSQEADMILNVNAFLPAAGQGAVGIEVLSNNKNVLAVISQLNCEQTLLCVSAERAALAALDGSCHTPIGAHAALKENGEMYLRVSVAALDGSAVFGEENSQKAQTIDVAERFGRDLGAALKEKIPAKFLMQKVEG